MQGGFEKNIQQQMQDFNLEPSPLVWKEIDAALDSKKRRRFADWWWLLPGVAALLVIFFGLIHFSTKTDFKQEESNHQSIQNTITKKDHHEEKQTNLHNDSRDEAAIAQDANRRKERESQTIKNEAVNELGASNSNQKNISRNDKAITKDEHLPKFTKSEPIAAVTDGIIYYPGGVPRKKSEEYRSPVNTLSAHIDSSYLENSKNTTSSLSTHASDIKIKTPVRKKQQWSLIAGGGTMSLKESSLGIFGAGSGPTYYYNAPGSIGSGNGSNSGGVSQPRPDSASYITAANGGYNFFAGIRYSRELSRSIEISSGVQYRFLSNKQKAGSYMYSSQYYTLTGGALLYNAGTTVNITNNAHWLEIPALMTFTLNPASNTRFSLQAGGSYAWMFASDWVLPDTKLNKLYYNDSLLNKHIFNVNMGAAVKLKSNISFGLQYQRSVTKLTNQANIPKLVWQNWSLYSTLPLQLKKRH